MSGVTYTKAGEGYFEKRTLKRIGRLLGTLGIGVAAVISGDFSGWNFGIGVGRLSADCSSRRSIVVVMYFGMMFSIGEMSAAHAAHRRRLLLRPRAMGPWGGFVTGLAETIEYVVHHRP